jgi:uncharacterized protein
MPWTAYLSLFTLGLLGGGHCLAMCGGFVAAIDGSVNAGPGRLARHLTYSAGRLASYAIAGMLVASVVHAGAQWFDWRSMQWVLYVVANLLLIATGIFLAGLGAPAARLEVLGHKLWQFIKPLSRHLLPANTLPRIFGAGMLWGWMPCGLVYAALGIALLSAHPRAGAGLMLAFGVGTLPAILGLGTVSGRLFRTPRVRFMAGLMVIAFGATGLAHASGLIGSGAHGLLCIL